MDQEQESTIGTEASGGKRGLGIIIGAIIGYWVGKTILQRAALGVVLGVALAFLIGSSSDDET